MQLDQFFQAHSLTRYRFMVLTVVSAVQYRLTAFGKYALPFRPPNIAFSSGSPFRLALLWLTTS